MSRVAEETDALVNKLHEQVYGPTEGEGTEDTQDVSQTTDVQQFDGDGTQGTPAQAEDSGAQTPDLAQQLQHKYDTLQGMYNSDISKLQSQVAFLQGMLADQPTAADTTTQAPTADVQAIEDLKTEYPYVLDAIYAVVRQELDRERQSILAEVSSVIDRVMARVNDVGMAAGKTQASLFWSRLTELVSDWEVWNTNRDFLAWLEEEDQLSGFKRFDLLKQAKADYNADKVATFFVEFKRQRGITQSPGRSLPSGQRMVAPGRSTGSVSQTKRQEGEEPLTRADTVKFYSDCKRGLYNGKEKERLAMEARIGALAASLGKRG